MKRIFTFLFLMAVSTTFTFAQMSTESSPLRGKLLLSVNGGLTIPQTDFKEIKVGPMGTGNLEYFFSLKSKHAFGLRVQGGGGTLKGKDERHPPYEFSDNFFFFGGGIVYSYAIDEVFLPYLFLGVANVWYNPEDLQGSPIITSKPATESLSKVNYNWEIGLKINISRRFALNFSTGEFLCPGDQLDGIDAGKHNDVFLYGTAGISVSFLGETDTDGDGIWDSDDACPHTPSGVEVDPMGCPLDTDRDGVPDYLDQCAGTPVGIEVDDEGCPIDSDKDGIPDYLDNCPDSPRGVPVDNLGCVKDSDNDGVPDYKDNCPGTPTDIHVDLKGCPDDLNKNGIPDYLEKNETTPEPKPEMFTYNLENEHLVSDMIFTDGRLYTAQISAWRTRVKADIEVEKLKQKGYNSFVTQVYFDEWNETWYRVRVGYFKTFEEAVSIAHKLR
jgi:hypothetical protein